MAATSCIPARSRSSAKLASKGHLWSAVGLEEVKPRSADVVCAFRSADRPAPRKLLRVPEPTAAGLSSTSASSGAKLSIAFEVSSHARAPHPLSRCGFPYHCQVELGQAASGFGLRWHILPVLTPFRPVEDGRDHFPEVIHSFQLDLRRQQLGKLV